MKAAPIPADDAARVADLHALNILDTKREERFDRITDLVADVFGVKMCFVNLVDAERQWFKSTWACKAWMRRHESRAFARTRSSSPMSWSYRTQRRIRASRTTRL